MADTAVRYYCHQCTSDIPSVTDEFTCPTCHSGFVEDLTNSSEESEDTNEPDHLGEIGSWLPSMLGIGMEIGAGPSGSQPGRSDRASGGRIVYRSGGQRPSLRGSQTSGPGAPNPDRHLENFLQELIFNVTGMGVAGGGGGLGHAGLSFHLVPGHQGFQITGEPGIQIHGNPGDYAWGRGGLDSIITQLLNQMDGAGPPPMAQENIKEIPTVNINSALLDKNPNCSVCWEDFKLEESVKQLECQHCFHKDCIVPWLELHGTCPVCRKVLNKEGVSSDPTDTSTSTDHDDEILLLEEPYSQEHRDARERSDSPSVSATASSSTTGGSTSTSTTATSAGAAMGASGGLAGFMQNAFSSILRGAGGAGAGFSGVGMGPGGGVFISPSLHHHHHHSHHMSPPAHHSPTAPGQPHNQRQTTNGPQVFRFTSQNTGGQTRSTSARTAAAAGAATTGGASAGSSGTVRRPDGSDGSATDDETPASRRQRLDHSEFIDFDLE